MEILLSNLFTKHRLEHLYCFNGLMISKREDVYCVVKAFSAKGEWMGTEARRYVQCLVREIFTLSHVCYSTVTYSTIVTNFLLGSESVANCSFT